MSLHTVVLLVTEQEASVIQEVLRITEMGVSDLAYIKAAINDGTL